MEKGTCEFGIQKFYALCIRSNQSFELIQCTYRLLLAVVQNECINPQVVSISNLKGSAEKSIT